MNISNDSFITSLQSELKTLYHLDIALTSDYLSQYDVIGFDIDYTISLYNNVNMLQALYESFTQYLIHHKDYPASLDYEANKDFIISLSSKDILLDITLGNALLLDSNYVILKAYHGKRQMTNKEIDSIYPNHHYNDFVYGIHYKEGKYFFSKNNFEFHIIPLYLLCVQLYDEGKLPANVKSYIQIQEEIFESLLYNFRLNDSHSECKESGYFYTTLAKEPSKYFHTDYNAKTTLSKLRDKGKKVFFATNSYYTYADFVLKNTIGDDYMDYFDLGFYFSKKPMFFNPDAKEKANECSCIFIDKTPLEFSPISDEVYNRMIQGDKALIGGSYVIVEEYFKRVLKTNRLKCLFVGDDLYSDCCVSSKLSEWDSVFILEEITTGYNGIDMMNGYRSGWAIDKDNNDNKENKEEAKNVTYETLKKYPKLILSNVDGIINFLL